MRVLIALLMLASAEMLLRVYHQRTLRRALPAELRPETRALTWDDLRDKFRIVCLGDSITFGEALPLEQAYPAVLVSAEMLLRVYHLRTLRRALPAELRPETRALTWNDIRNKFRIVCLGDSITFGEALPSAQAYPAVLAQLVAQDRPELDAAVINSGIRGQTSVEGLARLERDVLWYKPQVVVAAFGLNDARLGHWPLDPLREREMCGDGTLLGHIEPLLRRSHVWLTLRARVRRILRGFGLESDPGTPAGPALPRVSPRGFRVAQQQLIASIQRAGAAVLALTTTPTGDALTLESEDIDRPQQLALYAEYNRIIRDVAASLKAHLVDVNVALAERVSTEPATLLAPDGVHLTATGERLLAECILQALEDEGLLGERAKEP
jgi:lysophospholipase L1-like esterase